MRLNPSFNPAARNVLRRLERDYSALIDLILGAAQASGDMQGAEDRLKDVAFCYNKNFYDQFRSETAFKRWLENAMPDPLSLEAFYAQECRALCDRKPSPALAFEQSLHRPDMLRIEDEYSQFVLAYRTFQENLEQSQPRRAGVQKSAAALPRPVL